MCLPLNYFSYFHRIYNVKIRKLGKILMGKSIFCVYSKDCLPETSNQPILSFQGVARTDKETFLTIFTESMIDL